MALSPRHVLQQRSVGLSAFEDGSGNEEGIVERGEGGDVLSGVEAYFLPGSFFDGRCGMSRWR